MLFSALDIPFMSRSLRSLGTDMTVQEEWVYLDRDSKELRALDIHARVDLYDVTRTQPRIRPQLDLLVECKQSELPFVFFLSPEKLSHLEFPAVAGLFHQAIEISTEIPGLNGCLILCIHSDWRKIHS
jgi:hypothetical protein